MAGSRVGGMMTRTTGRAGQQQERSVRIAGEPGPKPPDAG